MASLVIPVQNTALDDLKGYIPGSSTQPNHALFFVKKNKESSPTFLSNWSEINLAGYIPIVGNLVGIARIAMCISHMKKENSEETPPSAADGITVYAKNIFRGIAEIVPLTSLPLMLVDATISKIRQVALQKLLKNEENIIGVAIDGEFVCSLPMDKVKEFIKKRMGREAVTDSDILNTFRNIVLRNAKYEQWTENTFSKSHLNPHLEIPYASRIAKIKEAFMSS